MKLDSGGRLLCPSCNAALQADVIRLARTPIQASLAAGNTLALKFDRRKLVDEVIRATGLTCPECLHWWPIPPGKEVEVETGDS